MIDCRAHRTLYTGYLLKYSPHLSFQVSLSKCKSSRFDVVFLRFSNFGGYPCFFLFAIVLVDVLDRYFVMLFDDCG